jgi:segregation and condensation protein B
VRFTTRSLTAARDPLGRLSASRSHRHPAYLHGDVTVANSSSERANRKSQVADDLPRDPALQRLEAILFAARDPLSTRKLAELANLEDGTRARTLVRILNQEYDRDGRTFRAQEIGGGFQLLTRPQFATWLRRLGHVPGELRLSQPAIETLAVIAYRQPVPKADLEAIRGVHCGEILRLLMARELVRIGGRSDELGRPYLYTTTKRFLQIFGLRSLEDLPPLEITAVADGPPMAKSTLLGQDVVSLSNEPDTTDGVSGQLAEGSQSPDQSQEEQKEFPVSVRISSDLAYEDEVRRKPGLPASPDPRLAKEDEDEVEFEDDDLEEDEDDDFEDDDEDDDDLDDDEEDAGDDDDDEQEDDFEDDEWEEVEDDEEEEGEDEADDEEDDLDEDEEDVDEEEEDDWDDEEDDDWDEDEEEEADDEE